MVLKVSDLAYLKLGTSGRWIGNLTGAGVTSHWVYDKAFLVAALGYMGIGGIIQARWKVLGLPYNWREIRDKQPFSRGPDRGWCHSDISERLSWSQSMHAWTERQHPTVTYLEFHVGCRLGRKLFRPPSYVASLQNYYLKIHFFFEQTLYNLNFYIGKKAEDLNFYIGKKAEDTETLF